MPRFPPQGVVKKHAAVRSALRIAELLAIGAAALVLLGVAGVATDSILQPLWSLCQSVGGFLGG